MSGPLSCPGLTSVPWAHCFWHCSGLRIPNGQGRHPPAPHHQSPPSLNGVRAASLPFALWWVLMWKRTITPPFMGRCRSERESVKGRGVTGVVVAVAIIGVGSVVGGVGVVVFNAQWECVHSFGVFSLAVRPTPPSCFTQPFGVHSLVLADLSAGLLLITRHHWGWGGGGGVPHHPPILPGPLRPLKEWAKFSSAPLTDQKISLAPSAPIGLDQKFSSAPLAPLKTQRQPGGGGGGGWTRPPPPPPLKRSPAWPPKPAQLCAGEPCEKSVDAVSRGLALYLYLTVLDSERTETGRGRSSVGPRVACSGVVDPTTEPKGLLGTLCSTMHCLGVQTTCEL